MLRPHALEALLRAHGLRLTKLRGQHHLVDARAVARIADACALTGAERVVEIGAGLGALTEAVAARARRVLAFEIDRGIAALLRERLATFRTVEVRSEDALRASPAALRGAVVVGAIPYALTSEILVWLTARRRLVRRVVLVVQREVADRLAARPGNKAYGRLSVLAQFGWRVEICFCLPASAFFPPPRVASACVRLTPHAAAPAAVADERAFFTVVKAAFAQRRKTLANCLLTACLVADRASAERLLARLGWPRQVRGETLSLEQFAALTRALAGEKITTHASQE